MTDYVNQLYRKSIVTRTLGLIEKHTSRHFKVTRKYNINDEARGVFSTSLYGDDKHKKMYERYFIPLIKNIAILKKIFPKWVYRVYLDPRISTENRNKLIATRCEVYVMNQPSNGHEGSMWRFLPAGESKPFISMDADDIVNPKDKYCYDTYWTYHVRAWLRSSSTFFQHKLPIVNTTTIPLTAKYWGGKDYCIPDIKYLINRYCQTWYAADEAFLSKIIYPRLKKNVYRTPNHIYEKMFYLVISLIIIIIIGWILYKIGNEYKI